MLQVAIPLLYSLGATSIANAWQAVDPTNEQEFNQIQFESPNPITWDMYSQALPTFLQTNGMKLIREKRDKCLQDTDYIMTIDYFNSLQNRDAWIAYRQALRIFPSTVTTILWIAAPLLLDWDAMGFPKAPPIIKNT
jgi:hypothetical protein